MQQPGTVTRVVNAIAAGALPLDADPTVQRIYDELTSLAKSRLRQETRATIQTADLVHEAYVKLFRPESGVWQSRAHFYGAAARAMQQVLVDAARRRVHRASLSLDSGPGAREEPADPASPGLDPVALSESLEALARHDPDAAELVRLRVFAGLSVEQAAKTLNIPSRTAYRRWTFAGAWLMKHMRDRTRVP